MRPRFLAPTFGLTWCLTTLCCSAGSPPQSEGRALEVEARHLFASRCTPCHGRRGRGDGPQGRSLDPKPRNFSSRTWQESTSDQRIERAVLYGGAALGLSPAMPPNPDLLAKRELLAALRHHIRTLAR